MPKVVVSFYNQEIKVPKEVEDAVKGCNGSEIGWAHVCIGFQQQADVDQFCKKLDELDISYDLN